MLIAIISYRKPTLTEWFMSYEAVPSITPQRPVPSYDLRSEPGEPLAEWFGIAKLCGAFYPEYVA